MMRLAAVLFVVAGMSFSGCNTKSTPGGPGATKPDTNKPTLGQTEETFSLSVPTLTTHIKQGETKSEAVSIKRGRNFDEDVTLKFENVPNGVTITPSSSTIKHGDTEAKITIKAADDAAVGDFTIKVTGHPGKGTDATSEFKLTVDKK